MAEHKFFGALTRIGETKLNRLGQVINLTDEDADQARRGGACILPAQLFDEIGFTEEELKKYPTPADSFNAPIEFKFKRDLALSLYHDLVR